MMQYNFIFESVEEKHLPLLYDWFKKPYVDKWWPVPQEKEDFFNSFLKRIRQGVTPFLVLCNNLPIGYIQTYIVDRNSDKHKWLPKIIGKGKLIGIDQFIGESDYLHKGFGTLFIKEFVNNILAEEKDLTVIVDPEPINAAAIRCYEKVGFKKFGEYKAPWGSALLMIYCK
jgi:RimJ/RimL family protein N-acetyltransferase